MAELLEREAALGALHEALAAAARGRGSIALIVGEPGIGKTALVTAFAQSPAPGRVLLGICDDLATPRPLGAFRDLAEVFAGPLAECLRRGRAPEAFPTLLLEELREGPSPTLLIIEDVHWADQATIDALTVVGRRLEALPVLLVLTIRAGELVTRHPLLAALDALQRTSTLHVPLAPLSRAAVKRLAGEESEAVYALSGGNPFFVTELIAHQGNLPPSLANAVLGRVARLGDESRRLLELISMVPGRVPIPVLDLLDPGWALAAEEAERQQLLSTDHAHVRYRHELTRAAIRSSVPPGRRRLLHRRILRALQEVGADAADMVHHAEAAGLPEVVAEHALVAAREAERLGSNREAFAHYVRATASNDRLDPEEEAQLWEGLARTAYLVGRTQEAVESLSRAISLHQERGQQDEAGRCAAFRAHLHWFQGEGRAAWQDACAAIRGLELTGPAVELARAYLEASELAMLSGREVDAVRWAERALRLARDDTTVRVRAMTSIGASRLQSDPEDVATLVEALHLAKDSGEHHQAVLGFIALAYVNLQWVRPEVAGEHAELGRRYAEAHEVHTMAAYLDTVLAWLRLRAGEWELAEHLAGALAHKSAPAGGTLTELQARTVLTELAVRRGDDGVDEQLAKLAADADRTGELKRIGPVLELQLERALTCGSPLPLACFDHLRRTVGDEPLREGGGAARVAAWASLCNVAWESVPQAPAPCAAMISGNWQEAADAFGAVGWRYDRALMLSLLDSQEHLNEALEIARSLDAGPLEQRIARRMQALAVPVPRGPHVTTRSNPGQLTDRQLEVLSLVGRGHSNAEIARALRISPRTVEHHVAGILTRLGATSRAEAVARAADLGLT